MFSLGRLLNHNRDRGGASEFVPIGQRLISPEKGSTRPQHAARVPLTADKFDNTHIESSFDETTQHFDTLEAADIGAVAGLSRSGDAGWNMCGKSASVLGRTNQLSDGVQSSIHGLQADLQQLKLENYSLKVEVATLKQFLKQTPPETQELVLQNAAFKQELMKTQDELEVLRRTLRQVSDQTFEHKQEMDALERLYKESLEEKDHEIHRLQRKLFETAEPKAPHIPQELLDKVEFLQSENQSLLRQLEDSAASDKTRSQFQSENNELKLELRRLKTQLAELPLNAGGQLEALERKFKIIEDDLQQAEDERDSLRNSLKNVQLLVEEKQTEIDSLSRSREESALSKNRSLRETDSRLEHAQHEVEDLKLKLKRREAELTLSVEDRNAETLRLQRKLESLLKELKEKDRDEYNLRAQLRSLMDERNRAFDNQSTVQHYQSQIETLREKEKSLFDENLSLKEDLARLHDEVHSHNTDSSRAAQLKQENVDLLDRLEFYEKEYALTQEAMEAAEIELDLLKTQQKRYDSERHSFETELETMRTKLRRSELNESHKYNESAYMELEESHRKREEAEHRRMLLQIEALNTQICELERQLELAKRDKNMYPSVSTYQPAEDNRLRSELQAKDFELKEKQRDDLKLQVVLKDKEDLIDALEERIRKLNKDFRTDFTAEDRYREILQKVKFDHESEILAILLERDRLQNEVKQCKARLELMEDDETQAPNSANSVTIALLEAQLDELRRKNHDLVAQLEKASDMGHDFTKRDIEENRVKLRELRFALSDAQQEKSDLETTRDTLESDLSLLRSEKSRSETKNSSLSQELVKSSRNCTRLANRVQDLENQIAVLLKNSVEAYRAQKLNLQLQNQVDQLGAKLASLNLFSPPNLTLTVVKTRLHENELKYFKAKLFELQTRYMDLALMNSFMLSSIKHSSQSCKDDLVKMALWGIYPDYSALNRTHKKITIKALAMFVLGAIRIKKRTEKAKAREVKLTQLRGEIEKDRITLLVEK